MFFGLYAIPFIRATRAAKQFLANLIMPRKRKLCNHCGKHDARNERSSGRVGRPQLNSIRLSLDSWSGDAKLPICIRWYAKTFRSYMQTTSTLRGSNDARTERVRQMAQRRGRVSASQRRIKRRLEQLRKLALKEASVDTKRVYLTLWQATAAKNGGKTGARWKKKGFAVLQFDNSEAALDITNSIVISTLRVWMKRGFVAALFESPTCASWSIASKQPCLRSCAHPWGLPNLPSKAQNKVLLGNQEGWIALGFLKHSYECNVPAALEHPATSYLLKTKEFFDIVKTCHAKLADFHQCCFGAAWWKPTTLVSVGKTPANQWVYRFGKQCRRKHNVCDFTGLPHVNLIGAIAKTASIYPLPMANQIADELAAQAAM